ncbi:hypothetical protein ACIRJO_03020 [Streptomyces sp. NPDC102394]|uniref:hypothetical protein n=1 Tax=Streptomyces sp. NPDC102394 TaxID=3366167 RepID=UPI003822AAB7
MLSTPAADKAWKAMTRTFPHQERSDHHPVDAGATAYATLMRGPQEPSDACTRTEPWLLLRDRTATRTGSC